MEEVNSVDKETFDYDSLWNREIDKKQQKIISDLPKGFPRTGIKGKYLKKKVHVGRKQLKNSWSNYFKSGEGKDIVSD